ncbi:UDP-N-acetylglucosamine/UDP-glucose/GDP-mannose transporter isoform X4 [Egretta garzetta]|uniref:UDP-N-acetylglucosamine/UDP-glucose/GDP-mannose transporter isoform X4 n=1 Tax=Egretta garzetta TaxID=188379 RepID=UPI00163C8212|nr:UDP-N-acetylglucosamine/UDP-glucose/GDP-mannose transporter isoform X4 [Egretta garzetta]
MFLGIGQMAATILILYVSKLNKIVHFPDFDKSIPVKLFPLPLIYVGNHISGLSSTSKLSLPMFTVLRKFTIPLTLLLEIIILGSDLSFNLEGYTFVLLNDIFTAANGVYTKQKIDPKELGKYGVLFYNACFMVVPTVIMSFSTGDFQQVSLDVFYCPMQSLQFCTYNSSSWCHQEYIHCLHWNVDWWRLHILHVKLHWAKYLQFRAVLLPSKSQVVWEVRTLCPLNRSYDFMAGGLRYSFLTLRGNSKPSQPGDEETALPESKS